MIAIELMDFIACLKKKYIEVKISVKRLINYATCIINIEKL